MRWRYILVGELALLTFAAIPAGWLVGAGLVQVIVAGLQSELYRVPAHLSTETFASATLVVLVAALASALIVFWRVRHLDLVVVLMTRELVRSGIVNGGDGVWGQGEMARALQCG